MEMFFLMLVICAIYFAMGYALGRDVKDREMLERMESMKLNDDRWIGYPKTRERIGELRREIANEEFGGDHDADQDGPVGARA